MGAKNSGYKSNEPSCLPTGVRLIVAPCPCLWPCLLCSRVAAVSHLASRCFTNANFSPTPAKVLLPSSTVKNTRPGFFSCRNQRKLLRLLPKVREAHRLSATAASNPAIASEEGFDITLVVLLWRIYYSELFKVHLLDRLRRQPRYL